MIRRAQGSALGEILTRLAFAAQQFPDLYGMPEIVVGFRSRFGNNTLSRGAEFELEPGMALNEGPQR